MSKILLLILLLLCDITTGFIRLSLIFSFVTTLPCRPSLPVHLFDGPISFPLNGPYPSSTPSEGLLVFDPSGTPPRPGVTLYQVPHRCIARTEIWTPVPFLVVDYKQCVLLDVRRFVVCPTLWFVHSLVTRDFCSSQEILTGSSVYSRTPWNVLNHPPFKLLNVTENVHYRP